MGFVSMLEDIRDRFADGAETLERELTKVETQPMPAVFSDSLIKQVNELRAIHKRFKLFLDEINEYLDFATDPKVQTSLELIELRKLNKALERRIMQLSEKFVKFTSELKPELENRELLLQLREKNAVLEYENARLSESLKDERKRYKQIEKEFRQVEKLMAQTPGRFSRSDEQKIESFGEQIDNYLDEEHMRLNKPNEFEEMC